MQHQKQLSLFDPLPDSPTAIERHSIAVGESSTPKSCSVAEIKKSATEQKTSGWVEIYSPSNRKNHHYYRYCYVRDRKQYNYHLRGGNTSSLEAQRLKGVVESAIIFRWHPTEILKLIK